MEKQVAPKEFQLEINAISSARGQIKVNPRLMISSPQTKSESSRCTNILYAEYADSVNVEVGEFQGPECMHLGADDCTWGYAPCKHSPRGIVAFGM